MENLNIFIEESCNNASIFYSSKKNSAVVKKSLNLSYTNILLTGFHFYFVRFQLEIFVEFRREKTNQSNMTCPVTVGIKYKCVHIILLFFQFAAYTFWYLHFGIYLVVGVKKNYALQKLFN
jgi:hypothetical protein